MWRSRTKPPKITWKPARGPLWTRYGFDSEGNTWEHPGDRGPYIVVTTDGIKASGDTPEDAWYYVLREREAK